MVALGGSGDGGTDRVSKAIARGLARHRSVAFLAKSPIQSAHFLEGMDDWRERLVLSPWVRELRVRRMLVAALRLASELRRLRATHVNFHYGGILAHAGDAVAARFARVRRTVVSLHHPHDTRRLPRAWRLSHQLAARWSDALVVTTPYAAGQIRHLSGNRPVEIVPIGCPSVPEAPGARARLALPENGFVVGVLARLVPEKRVERVVEACRTSRAFARSGFLVIAGTGPELERLSELVDRNLPGRARVIGRPHDPTDFYRSIDIFMLLSEFEGFGLVFAEAASAGVPSICSDAGGAPYVVEHGRTGWLVPEGLPEAAASFLDAWAESPTIREEMRLACTDIYRQRFTEERMVENYDRLIFRGIPSSLS